MPTISEKITSPLFKLGLLSLAVFVLLWFGLPWGIEYSRQLRAGALIDNYLQRDASAYKNYFNCVLPLLTPLPADNNINQAVDLLEKAARNPPNSPHTYYLLGKAYCLQENYEAAIQSLETYYSLRPKNPLGPLEQGFAYFSWAQLSPDDVSVVDSIQAFQRADVDGQLLLAQGDQAYKNNHQLTAWIMYRLAAMFVKLPEITLSKLIELEASLPQANLIASILENEYSVSGEETSALQMESTPTATPTPTQTPEPLPTPTATLGPALKTPFGPPENPLLVHQAGEGESLQMIADQYNTTVPVLETINDFSLHPLWIGDTIVVCVGCVETPDLPKLKALYLETDIEIVMLAEEVEVSEEDLRRWNGLGNENWIIAPRWIVVPHNNLQ